MKPFRVRVRAVLAALSVTALAAVTLGPQQAEASDTTYSEIRLEAARVVLDSMPAIPGTAWVTDPRVGKLVVSADPTVKGAELARLNRAAKSLGDVVLVKRTATKLTRYIAGGGGIYGGKYRCSLGFNVLDANNNPYFLTAGHCGNVEPQWAASPDEARAGSWSGKTVSSTFPGEDHALVQYAPAADHLSRVDLYGGTQPITRAADPAVGDGVTRSGSTTHVHSGKVTGLNATVNYPEGTVSGLIQTDVCAEGGDSGGPLFHDNTALGLTSGGNGNCMIGGTTYYEPVTRALAEYGMHIG
ncbi:S1 family peptidase [Streptomyces sp. NPDC002537]